MTIYMMLRALTCWMTSEISPQGTLLKLVGLWVSVRLLWLVRTLVLDDTLLTEMYDTRRAVARMCKEYPRCFKTGRIILYADETVPSLIVGWCFVITVEVARDMNGCTYYNTHVYRLHHTQSARLSLDDDEAPLINDVLMLQVWENTASGHNPDWTKTNQVACLPHQLAELCMATADAIVRHVKDLESLNGFVNARILITGEPGHGKSTAVRIAAAQLDAHFTSGLQLCSAGSMLSSFISLMDVGQTHVVLVDEVEDVLKCMLPDNGIALHPKMRTQVRNRANWNKMCDDTRYVGGHVMVLTSNMTPKELTAFDLTGAALRKGRLTAIFNIGGGYRHSDRSSHEDDTLAAALRMLPDIVCIDHEWHDASEEAWVGLDNDSAMCDEEFMCITSDDYDS